MPISYRVDHEARVVVAAAHGVVADADVFGYQREVWSRKDVGGSDELNDMAAAARIDVPSGDRVRDLAKLAAGMDEASTKSRFAIVASDDMAYGLGRMFQTFRGLDDRSTK